jgi:hypothetical protein
VFVTPIAARNFYEDRSPNSHWRPGLRVRPTMDLSAPNCETQTEWLIRITRERVFSSSGKLPPLSCKQKVQVRLAISDSAISATKQSIWPPAGVKSLKSVAENQTLTVAA